MKFRPVRLGIDHFGGILTALIGLAAVMGGRAYQIGTLAHMGPGFFPAAVGLLMIVVGIGIAATARAPTVRTDRAQRAVQWRSTGCIVGSLLAFIVFSAYGGFIPASFGIVFISALADKKNSAFDALLLALVMLIVSVTLFWALLGVQLPLWAWGRP